MGDSPNPTLCANCGHKLTPEDRFCPECGARAPERPSAPAAGAPPTVVIHPGQAGAETSPEATAALIFCMNCGRKLTPEDRFCPECGTRAPEQPSPSATGAPPTVVIPPQQPTSGAPPTVVIPPQQPTPGVPPTVIIPPEQPPMGAAPTVVISSEQPPAGVPPIESPSQPTVGRTPSSYPPPVIPPAQSVGTPPDPFMPPPVTHASYGPPPAGTDPFQVPSTTSPMQTAGTNKWLIWGLVGGSGCLLLILIGICVFIAVSIFVVVDSVPTSSSTEATATTGDGGSLASGSSGRVLFSDDFENPQASELGESEDSSSRYVYEAGRYVIEVKEPELLVWALVNGSYRDVIIETSYSTVRGGPVGAAGIIFNYQNEDNFYLFSVSNDGYYALELLENNQWITLIDWTQHEAIDTENNRLRVELNGDEITLFVNERQLEQTRDPTFTHGDIGLAVTSFDQSGITVSYEEITIRSR
ncbi:zinc ribbon domain-containing protein [Chloroflexus sp.]|uniref:zinc ribbon domain-containing protein n=1 Tax=Chloroflexus sp. TaxID=1904827 RepID=UPI002ADE94C8|nr:zinc-ribbon domain-containing protein [Chloroflexus sp.]